MALTDVNNLNIKLKTIWDDHIGSCKGALHPVYYGPLYKNTLTFVGMNPSFSRKGLTKTLKGSDYESQDLDAFFSISNKSFDFKTSSEISKLSKDSIPFFKLHREIAGLVRVDHWNHIDLFQYRHTKQSEFLKKVRGKGNKLNDFGQKQFDLSMQALELSQPKIIIIANAAASHIFCRENPNVGFSDEIGTYEISLNQKKVPVFLSGMLTGQRALDVYSRKRLLWHVERIYNNQQAPTS